MKRLFAEGCVIVISILVAFAVDAWWENRQEEEAARWLVARLHADFTEIRADLDVAMADHLDALEAATRLAEHRGPLPITPEFDALLYKVFIGFRTFNPGSGSVEVFLNSEASRMIENRPLADLLVRWPSIVDEMREDEAMLSVGAHNRWRPYLMDHVDIRDLTLGTDPEGRQPLVADAEFFGHVIDRLMIQQYVVRDMEPVSQAVDSILEIVSEEIAE